MRWMDMLIGCGLLVAMAAMAGAQEKSEPKEPWTHETAKVNGINMHYATVGKGQVILFLHGFPEFWYEWREQLPFFGKSYQAVAPDMRGYNLTDKPAKVEDYAIPILVADIKALLDHVSKGKKAILVAHDWGGALAWTYAAMHPDTLEKLVIINAPHPNVFGRELEKNPKQQAASSYMNFFRSPQAESQLSANDFALLSSIVFTTNRPNAFSEEDKKRYKKAWGQPGALTGGLNYYRAAQIGPPSKAKTEEEGQAEKSALTQLPELKIPMPTLVIWGEKDTALLTGNLEGLNKYVPNLTIKRIPNGSHWVIHEEPELINKTILDFLKK